MITLHTAVQNCTLKVRRWPFIICAALLMLTTANLAVAENASPQQPKALTSQQKQKSKEQQKQIWPRPFTPSEKISADQAVAFPVDI